MPTVQLANPMVGWSPHARYGFAVAAVGGAFVTRLLLVRFTGSFYPLVPFLIGALAAARVGGVGPGVLASVLGMTLGEWHFVTHFPHGTPAAEFLRCTLQVFIGCAASIYEGNRSRSMQRLQTILSSITDAFCTLDEQCRFQYANSRAEQQLGQTQEQLRGTLISDAGPLLADALTYCRRAAAGETQEWEVHLANEERWFECKAYPSAEGLSLLWREVTERRRADQQFRETSEMLGAIVRASPLPIIAITTDGHITLWNAAAERTFGWTEQEVRGQLLPFIPADQLQEHRVMRQQDLSGVGITNKEIRRLRKDGSFIDLIVSTALMRDETSAVQGIMSVYLDVTEQKRSADLLRQQEAQLRLITEALPASISYIDRDLRYRFSNRAHRDYWSNRESTVVGKRVEDVVGPELLHTTKPFIEAVLRGETVKFEWDTVRLDGRPLLSQVTFIPDRIGDDPPVGFVSVVEDLTQIRQDQQYLRQMNQRLERANEELHQFSYAASHDLQEPLRTVISYSQLVTRQYGDRLDQRGIEFLGYVVDGARRMSNMLQSLRQYWQLGSSDEPMSQVECESTVQQALLNLQVAIEQSHAKVECDALPVVLAHEVALVQLWQNLISNAIKYHRAGVPPHVHISAETSPEGWLFTVADNGMGIPDADRERVFRVFKRLHGPEYPGTGIGLAMCAKIVERHGGSIWCESEVGEGTRFHFTLPPVPATMRHVLETEG